MTIWEPIKLYKALRWDSSISAEDYLRAGAALMIFVLLSLCFAIFIGIGIGFFGTLLNLNLGENLKTIEETGISSLFTQDFGFYIVVFPFLAFVLFMMLYLVKLAVMRLHAFNLSGWWVLAVIFVTFGLEYIETFFLAALFYSVTTYLANFYPKKMISRWQYQSAFERAPKTFEEGVITVVAVMTWFTILADPLFILIDMI